MYTFIIATVLIAVVTLIASRLARNETIQIPREPGPGTGNELGYKLFQNICPRCGNTEGFFKGEKKGHLYCGTALCRAGFSVLNYGQGEVWANEVEQGPDYLYYGQGGERLHRQSRVWKVEGIKSA